MQSRHCNIGKEVKFEQIIQDTETPIGTPLDFN